MLIQHVMYKDILAGRTYIRYPYFNKFDVDDDKCLYAYRDNEIAMHDYIDNYTSPEYLQEKVVNKIRESYELSEDNAEKIIKLFSSRNPAVRLTVYGGGEMNRVKFFEDIGTSGDPKRTLLELTGELNAIAMDGLFSLYASALYYLEGKENTENAKRIKENYKKLINGAYIYMKRGTAMEFFFMPIADIEKATDNKDINALMDSCNNFTEVYLRNNGTTPPEGND